jgi:hypothetical protein
MTTRRRFPFPAMTKTDIANLALAKLGSTQINSIDDPNEKAARTMKAEYDQARDEVLRRADWGFALIALPIEPETGSEPLTAELCGWAHAFALPADMMRIEKITTPDGEKIDKHRKQRANGKRCILCNSNTIVLHYVARIDDPNDYDPLFLQSFATLLAARGARAITGSEEMETTLVQRYEAMDLPNARATEGQETESNENHPMNEILGGAWTGRGSFNFGHGVIAEPPED